MRAVLHSRGPVERQRSPTLALRFITTAVLSVFSGLVSARLRNILAEISIQRLTAKKDFGAVLGIQQKLNHENIDPRRLQPVCIGYLRVRRPRPSAGRRQHRLAPRCRSCGAWLVHPQAPRLSPGRHNHQPAPSMVRVFSCRAVFARALW